MSNCLWLHGLQYAMLPCPSLSPRIFSDSCPLIRWCYPVISLPVTPFSFCPQTFPASESFPMSWLFASGGQSFGASASSSALASEYSGLIFLRIDWLDVLAIQRTLKSILQCHSLKASILWHSALSSVQLSHLYITTGKTIRSDQISRSVVSNSLRPRGL